MRVNLKFIWILTTLTLLFISCSENCSKNNLEITVSNYIDSLKSRHKLRNIDQYVIHIHKDSSNSKYEAYRMSASAELLLPEELPNKIDKWNGVKIAYFTENLINEDSIKKQQSLLKKEGFYIKGPLSVMSNYPEWILLRRMDLECFEPVQYAHYQDLDEIINKLNHSETE